MNNFFIDEPLNSWMLGKIPKAPSDVIKLSEDSAKKLMDLWRTASTDDGVKKERYTPSDLFFANTVPLMDCSIEWISEKPKQERPAPFRVVIFDDYCEILNTLPDDSSRIIGCVIINLGNGRSFIPVMQVEKGCNYILGGKQIGWRGFSITERDATTSIEAVLDYCAYAIQVWYGIQVALLHPTVRDVFCNPSIENYNKYEYRKHKKKNIVRYIKRHIIKADELDELIYGKQDGEKKTIKRTALVWYVIGHWRAYQNGRKIFIQPFWKGALRELKKPMPEREREIAQVTT